MEISAQDKVASLAIGGHNVFFTGAAGTGKTTLVKKLSSLLTQKTAVTSTTGISSSLYENSKTIHSFAGIRDARGNPEAILEHISEQSSVVARWRETDTLIIDEMSMLSRRTFELLNFVGQKMRNNASPFGGLQVIGCGDFLQLPPVPSHYDNGDFCFTSPLWNTVFPHTVVLDEVFRQRDQAFVDTLHCVAWGDLSGGTVEQLSQLTTPLNPADHGLQYIPRIYAQNLDVDYYNMDKLHHLDGHTHMKHYKAEDSGSKKLLNESLVVQEHLYLKVNAPVMLLYNLTDSLKNGMTGTVTGFSDSGYPVVHFPQVGTEEVISPRLWTVPSPDNTNKVLASRRQVPLKLSWAFTVHKSQGMTLKAAEVHCRGIFSPGQLYTALSRLKSTEGLRVVGFKPEYLIKPNAEVIRFMTDATESNEPADPSLQCCRKINQEQVDCAGEQQPVQQVDELLPSASNSLGDSDSECDEDNVLVTQVFNELPNHTSHCNDDHGETTDLQAAAELLKDDSELSSLPQDFSVEEFFNTLEDHSSFASIPGSSPHNLNCLLQSLQNADKHHSRAFLSLQWSRIYHLIKGNSESESVEKANKKTFVSYLSDFHEYVTTNENLECEFKQLCGTLTLTDTHYECLADICISLRNQLVEKLATAVRLKMSAGRTTSTDHRNSSENMTNEGKGKVRFVGGWTVAKEREKNRRYLKGNIGSTDAEVRRNLRRAYTKKVLLDSMTVPAAAIATNTAYPETLSFTQHKQNRRNGLTHITDKAFMFFLRVEDMRNVCLTQSNLDRHKENLINNTVTSVLNDKSMQAEFIKALEIPEEMLAKDVHTSHDATLTSEAESCAYALFSDVVKRYFNMGTGQFLRDHRRDLKVQKTTAHRKRVMQREQSSLTKSNKIGVEQFISDSSDNKMFSHTLLQSRVTANPKFFEERIYTKQELKLFFLLYNLTYVRSHTKSTMNSKLVNRIKESQCILNTAALQQYLDGLGPLEKRPRFN